MFYTMPGGWHGKLYSFRGAVRCFFRHGVGGGFMVDSSSSVVFSLDGNKNSVKFGFRRGFAGFRSKTGENQPGAAAEHLKLAKPGF